MAWFSSFWADSRGKVIVILFLLWIATLLYSFRSTYVFNPVASVIAMVIWDSLFSFIKTRTVHISLSTIITGLLVGFIVDPTGGEIFIITTCLLASLSKNFIGKGLHHHIFNPAAFGVVATSLIFGRPVAWWAGSWGIVPVIILGLCMTPILWGLRRFWMPVTFLTLYFLTNSLASNFTSAWRLTLDGTVFLFAFVMLPEIKTSPAKGYWQYSWGILVGALVYLQSLLKFSFVDPLLFALLIANAVGFIAKERLSNL